MLLAARGTAEVSRRLKQPEVLGELLGGFFIGPSVLGAVFPHAFHDLFQNGVVSLALQWMSWIGAVLLLMIAGMEADLAILRQKILPGLLAAAGAIGASVGIGSFLGARLFRLEPTSSFFLGLVLSVTAVSVVAKLLIEREALRRDYAQVMLAAGIAGEVLVWPLISIVSSIQHRGSPWIAGLRATGLAAGFFLLMFTLGRRFTYWAMRRVADATAVPNGELSLILVLMLLSAAITTALGLHPLLGAFVFGVLLGKAPRATIALKENVQAITISLFAPIFFALAGMRVNLFNLRGWSSVEAILMLLVVASSAKILFGFAGARLGGLPTWEAATVGVGLTLKGGTDVVVAIVGTELLLLSPDLYTTYAVVAILTVIVTPPLVNWLANKTAPGIEEMNRLNREEARKLAYLADRERVLVPLFSELMPSLSARIVAIIAAAKQLEGELFDVTEVALEPDRVTAREGEQQEGSQEASDLLAKAATMAVVEVGRITSPPDKVVETLEAAAGSQHLLVMGAPGAFGGSSLSFGEMQDRLLREISTDVLIAVHPDADFPAPRRILVPITSLVHSYAAADVAAYLAKGSNADVVLLTVMAPRLGALFWKERKHRDLLQAGYTITREAKKRMSHLDVPLEERVVLSADPVEAIVSELKRGAYDLMVLGSILRSSADGISLGSTVEHLLQVVDVPRVLLVSRNTEVATLRPIRDMSPSHVAPTPAGGPDQHMFNS